MWQYTNSHSSTLTHYGRQLWLGNARTFNESIKVATVCESSLLVFSVSSPTKCTTLKSFKAVWWIWLALYCVLDTGRRVDRRWCLFTFSDSQIILSESNRSSYRPTGHICRSILVRTIPSQQVLVPSPDRTDKTSFIGTTDYFNYTPDNFNLRRIVLQIVVDHQKVFKGECSDRQK